MAVAVCRPVYLKGDNGHSSGNTMETGLSQMEKDYCFPWAVYFYWFCLKEKSY